MYSNARNNNACCNQLLNINCQTYQLYVNCPPVNSEITLSYLSESWITPTISAVLPKTKCGKVTCCDGIAQSILCAFQVTLSALASGGDEVSIFESLAATLTGILTLAGIEDIPDYPEFDPG